jgi:hypothetical protein
MKAFEVRNGLEGAPYIIAILDRIPAIAVALLMKTNV